MTDTRNPPPLSELRMPALDGIRGVAVLLVIPHNTSLVDGVALHGFGYPLKELLLFGWAGVQLFFVLSGFLISGALLDTQDSSNYYSSFYARRALRILPLYYGTLIVSLLLLTPLQMLPQQTLATSHAQIWLWTFLSNWTDPLLGGVYGLSHFWSLAVEEQFYLLWPLILYRRAPQSVFRLCIAIAVAALAIRTTLRLQGSPPDYLYEFTVCRMDALALGGAAAAWLRMPRWQAATARALPYLPWVALLLGVTGAVSTHDFMRTGFATQTFGQSVLAVVFTLMVLAAARRPEDPAGAYVRVLSWAPLRSVGKYSYAMYVFHFPLHRWLVAPLAAAVAPEPGAAAALAYAVIMVLASYLLAWVSFNLYERHFLRLKRFFLPQRQPLTAIAR